MLVPAFRRAGPCGPWPLPTGTTQTGRMVIDRVTPARLVRRSRSRPAALVAVLLALTALAPVAQASPNRAAAPLPARTVAVPSAVLVPASAAADSAVDATSASITTLGSTITFHGRGSGHGVGMSQYGARGRAKAGESATRILAAYYRTARPATTDPAQVVRVLLRDRQPATTASPLVIHGRGGSWTVA